MKKWLALLLAILMVLALAACTKTGNNDNKPVDNNPDDTTTSVEESSYQTVDETVYTAKAGVQLYKELDNTTGAVTIEKAATELHRIRVSTKLQASVVKYKGEEYYVSSGNLITADLYGKKFTPVDRITMYAKSNVKVRSCASSDDKLSEVVATLAKNDEVTVIAKGNGWSKIDYSKDGVSGEYFVSSEYLTEEKEIDYSNIDYSSHFVDANVTRTVLQNLNVRNAPVLKSDVVGQLKKDQEVKIIAYGKGEYASWGMIFYPNPVQEGETQTYSRRYIKLCDTDCVKYYIEVPDVAVKNQIAALGFTTKSETLYVAVDNLYLREAPGLTEKAGLTVKKGDQLTVVATGNVTEPAPDNSTRKWVMVRWMKANESGDTNYGYLYASMNGLAGSLEEANGALTLEQLKAKYQAINSVEETTITAKGKVVCYFDLGETKSGVELKAGDEVTLVAKSDPIDNTVWYVFRMENGAFFCAGKELFN